VFFLDEPRVEFKLGVFLDELERGFAFVEPELSMIFRLV
jgi:hypothetical protein